MDRSKLDETQHFTLTTGSSVNYPDRYMYQIWNKQTGILEAEGPSMAQAIRYLHHAERDLQDALADPTGTSVEDNFFQGIPPSNGGPDVH